ncbi:CBN-INS-23 protein [Caenorhabditis brenneri]|uniref:CBN-INS-23 protein n=1 Tax=Caenorhabditis brenneri TaxID=135651 RepID=G0MKG0_CAEBE|nr:CBN-INS-23 protein [Caenorhabditis brenneri]
MSTTLFFILFLTIASSLLATSADAHSDTHVQKLCGKHAFKNIRNLCSPKMETIGQLCIEGDLPNTSLYCHMGYSDSQVKYMCCPGQDLQ